MKKNHNAPVCKRCQATGAGVQFPMFPRAKGATFGDYCVPCDEEIAIMDEVVRRATRADHGLV